MKPPALLVHALLLIVSQTVQSQSPIECMNSWLRFDTRNPVNNVKFFEINCLWAAKRMDVRCKYDHVRTHCPRTCGTCGECVDSGATFISGTDYTTCAALGEVQEPCKLGGIDNTCRATCDNCGERPEPPADSPVTAPNDYCANSWMKFRTEDLDGKRYAQKNCIWIGKQKGRCKFDNVRSHCAETCGACGTCTDSTAEFFFRGKYTNCEAIDEFFCQNQGIANTCIAKCNTCISSHSSPTATSSATPSAAPVSTPSTCDNSWTRFNTREPITDKIHENKNCAWVSKNLVRCNFDNVRSHCSKMCEACGTCADSTADFFFRTEYTTCEEIDTSFCQNPVIANTCRVKCNNCGLSDDVPSPTPSAAPVSTPFTCVNSWLSFNIIGKSGATIELVNCLWVNKKQKLRCGLDGVRSHCPETCGPCETCADSTVSFQFENKYTTCESIDIQSCKNNRISNTCRVKCGTCGPSSDNPSSSPSVKPTASPTKVPSSTPSVKPSPSPSAVPSDVPNTSPSTAPTSTPSVKPSNNPSPAPSLSKSPSSSPSSTPSTSPPTPQPSDAPPVITAVSVCGSSAHTGLMRCNGHQKLKPRAEKASVRCCSNTIRSGWMWTKRDGCDVWATSLLNRCYNAETWSDAKYICETVADARLCTAEEVATDCTKQTGCGSDTRWIWTSSFTLHPL